MNPDVAERIFGLLSTTYDISMERDEFLHFTNPFEILIATILSAQTTDKIVNKVTRQLFLKYSDSKKLSEADLTDIEDIIHSTGFFHSKARKIIETSKCLESLFGGDVPDTLVDLLQLPGVGRKTALIVLDHAYGKREGIAVDTHVKRLSMRLGLSNYTDPVKIERDLLSVFREEHWGKINGLFILHGRRVCTARNPACNGCILFELCNFTKKTVYGPSGN